MVPPAGRPSLASIQVAQGRSPTSRRLLNSMVAANQFEGLAPNRGQARWLYGGLRMAHPGVFATERGSFVEDVTSYSRSRTRKCALEVSLPPRIEAVQVHRPLASDVLTRTADNSHEALWRPVCLMEGFQMVSKLVCIPDVHRDVPGLGREGLLDPTPSGAHQSSTLRRIPQSPNTLREVRHRPLPIPAIFEAQRLHQLYVSPVSRPGAPVER
jgi:hypothetical protein